MDLDDKTPMEEIEGIDQAIIDEVMADEGGGEGEGAGATSGQTQQQTQMPSQTPTSAAAAGQQSAQPAQQQFDPYQAFTTMQTQMQQMAQVLQQLAQQPQQSTQQQQPQPPKDEDPLANLVRQHLESVLPNQLKPIQEMQQYFQQFQQQQQRQANLERSVATAQSKYADFIEVVTPIHQRMLNDPAFNELILNMPDPAEFAYTMALGMQAQASRAAQGQAQVNKLQQMSAMPRSMQVKGGSTPSSFDNLEDMIDNFENLTPVQQAKLLKLTNRSD